MCACIYVHIYTSIYMYIHCMYIYVNPSAIIESPMNCSTSSVMTSHDLDSCGEYNHGRMKMNNTHVNIAVQPPPPLLFFHITQSFFPFNCILHSLSVKERQNSAAANQPAVIRFQRATSIFNNTRDNLMQMSSAMMPRLPMGVQTVD